MPAAPRATLLDIARHAGVSRATVSLVLRDSPLVAAETRGRVHAAVQAVGYLYNRGAATLRGGQTRTVGLLVTEIDNPFFGEMIAGAEAALDAAGYIAFLATTGDSPDRQARTLRRLLEHGVDGLILCAAAGTEAAPLAVLLRHGTPCVQALREVPGSGGDYAGPDNARGMEALGDHLIGLGHRRIAFAGTGLPHSGLRARLEGVQAALRRHGLSPAIALPSLATRAGGAEAAGLLRALPGPPTALVCANDVMAFGAIPVLEQAGLRVGRDIAVTGVGDVPEAALFRPPLTTLATRPRRIGEEASRLLLRRIADPGIAPERVVLPAELVVRASTG